MIRKATEKDLPKVCNLVCKGISEMDYNPNSVEPELVVQAVLDAFKQAPCYVVEKNGEIIGCAPLAFDCSFWSSKRLLTSLVVYVLPQHRNFGIIKELYECIKKFAKLQGVSYVDIFNGMDKFDVRARLSKAQKLTQVGIVIKYDWNE